MAQEHQPVLLVEAINYLQINPNGIYVDCTLGRAGHAQEILKKLNHGQLYAIDQDPEAIGKSAQILQTISNNFEILNGNFDHLAGLLALKKVFAVDGILYDLGVSSPQFDVASRGFSYRFDGPLDMRMDPTNNPLTAAQVINQQSAEELSYLFKTYGDEKHAKQIAQAIVKQRPLNSTFELVNAIKKGLPQKVLKQKGHPAKKVFQALRIYVNDEINVLKNSLQQALTILKPQGRIVVITFHSLEEKVVKETFKQATESPSDWLAQKLPVALPSTSRFKLVISKPVKASEQEIEQNPRAHSAKMWVLEKR